MPKASLILYACGSRLIVDFIEVCLKNDVEIKAVINNLADRAACAVACVSAGGYDFAHEQTPFLVPLFTPSNRHAATQEALDRHLVPYGLLSDRNNDLPADFEHGAGCFINKAVVIGGASRIGAFGLINRGACLGHHNDFGDFVSIGPGAVTGGDVVLRTGVLLGTGAVVLPSVTVGEHAVIGAGSVVTRDVAAFSVVVGNPARHIKENASVF